jgi:putative peptidoglycan lipid II flippase
LGTQNIAFGLAASASFSGMVQIVWALKLLSQKLGKLELGKLAVRYLQFYAAALPSAALGLLIVIGYGGRDGEGLLASASFYSVFIMVVVAILMTIIYISALLALRNRETLEIIGAIRRRLKPKKYS